jgi:hypothetical protein
LFERNSRPFAQQQVEQGFHCAQSGMRGGANVESHSGSDVKAG